MGTLHIIQLSLPHFRAQNHGRSGVAVHAGVMDAGYTGVVGALMQVFNEHGVRVSRDARLAQMVFHSMSERVEEGYKGVYQGARGV